MIRTLLLAAACILLAWICACALLGCAPEQPRCGYASDCPAYEAAGVPQVFACVQPVDGGLGWLPTAGRSDAGRCCAPELTAPCATDEHCCSWSCGGDAGCR